MAIDYDVANADAAQVMGILPQYDEEHGEDAGWAFSVLQQMEADQKNSWDPASGESSFNRSDYDADELALYDWFNNTYLADGGGKWDKAVEGYQEEHKGEDIKADEVPDYQPPAHSDFEPPETNEYSGGNNSNKDLRYSTEAINHLIKQIDLIAPSEHDGMLLKVHAKLNDDGNKMKPGGFAAAEIMRRKVDGASGEDAGLRGDVMGLLETIHYSLDAVREGLVRVRTEYDKADEFNAMTADDLAKVMDEAWSYIGSIKSFGGKPGATAD